EVLLRARRSYGRHLRDHRRGAGLHRFGDRHRAVRRADHPRLPRDPARARRLRVAACGGHRLVDRVPGADQRRRHHAHAAADRDSAAVPQLRRVGADGDARRRRHPAQRVALRRRREDAREAAEAGRWLRDDRATGAAQDFEPRAWRRLAAAQGSELRVVFAGGGTGGHVYPGLAVARALQMRAEEQREPLELLYIGVRGRVDETIVPREGLRFRAIAAGQLRVASPLTFTRNVLRLAQGALQSISILRRFKPDAVFATGGYARVP